MSIAPYPWHALDRLPRAVVPKLSAARQALASLIDTGLLGQALSEVLREPTEIIGQRMFSGMFPPSTDAQSAWCLLESPDARQQISLCIEPEFAAWAASRVAGCSHSVINRLQPVPAAVQGAVGALVLATARRCAPEQVLSLAAVGDAARDRFEMRLRGHVLHCECSVLVGSQAFRAIASISALPLPTQAHGFDLHDLRRLGALGLPLRLVVGLCEVAPEQLAGLHAGGALMPGSGWWVERCGNGLAGNVALCAPASTAGFRAKLLEDDRIVLGEGVMNVEADSEMPLSDQTEASPADVLAQAPLVVRVELGCVSLTASQWAALRPGDVVATGRRVAERVTLRIGGHNVATGELVDIDGELGVRIHALSNDGGKP